MIQRPWSRTPHPLSSGRVLLLPIALTMGLGCTPERDAPLEPLRLEMEVGDPAELGGGAQRTGFGLSLTTSLEAGETSQFVVTGAPPGQEVLLAFSLRGQGSGPCPPTLGGLCLDLIQPQILSRADANAQGTVVFTVNVPPTPPPGAALSTQAVVPLGASSLKTNARTDLVNGAPTRTRPSNGGAIVLASNQLAIAANRTADQITVLNVDFPTSATSVAATFDVPDGEPWAAVVDNDGRNAFVVLRNTAEVVRVRGLQTTPTLSADRAEVDGEPTGIAISPNGTTLYVPNWTAGTVSLIDAVSMQTFATVDLNGPLAASGLLGPSVSAGRPGLARPYAVVVTDDGDGDDDDETVYVTEFFSQDDPTASFAALGDAYFDVGRQGVVYAIDTGTRAVRPLITLGSVDSTGFLDSAGSDTGCFPNQLYATALDGDRLYVTSVCASPRGPAVGGGVNAKTKVHGLVSVIDTTTDTELVDQRVLLTRAFSDLYDSRGVPDDASRRFPLIPNAFAFLPGTHIAYFTAYGSDAVFRLEFAADGSVLEVGSSLRNFINLSEDPARTGRLPVGIAIPSFPRALVLNENTRNVSVLDLGLQVAASVTPTADPPAPGAETDANTGQRFFVTGLARWSLNGQGWNSCEGCHPNGLTDNVTWFFAAGPRQTSSLDASFDGQGEQRIFNWTAILDEISDFELNTRGVSGGVGAIVHTTGSPLSVNHRILFEGAQPAGQVATLASQANLTGSIDELIFSSVDGVDATGTPTQVGSVLDDWDLITQWVRTLRAPRAPANLDAADVAAGRALFSTAGCQGCHGGDGWTISERFYEPDQVVSGVGGLLDTTSYALGTLPAGLNPPAAGGTATLRGGGSIQCVLRNVGTFPSSGDDGIAPPGVSVEERRQDMVTLAGGASGFNPPSLVGAGAGAPYFHAGNARTLEEVFDPTFQPHTRALSAVFTPNATQIRRLVAFMSSIDDDALPVDPTVPGVSTVICPPSVP
jgi:DNA-binding beta-propeller fold protein YncE